jgi:hypothetical protein
VTTTAPPLLMTMSDIAALARVQRPVVSVWRSRAAASEIPFPAPVAHDRGQDLFDAATVGAWLAKTGRGNNPDAAADAAAHAAPSRDAQTADDAFPAITALLALRSLVGGPLGALTPDDLLDAADEHDPDDEMLYREIEGAGDDRARLVQYVDDAVEAGYGEAAVFERLVAEQFTGARRDLGDTSLSAAGLDLMSQIALALASTQSTQSGEAGESAIVDLIGSSTDTLIASAKVVDDLSVVTANTDDESGRLQRRRLTVHRIPHTTIEVQDDGSFTLTGSSVHVIRLPAVDDPAASPVQMLSALDRVILQMDAAQLAVVLAPSAVLSDGSLHRDADQVRSDLLRSGRVRAIVRLPVGLRPRKPQQAQTLWIVGDTRAKVELAERWTMVADLSAVRLDQGVITDLVSDLVASLGDLATVRAHAFRFVRLVLTRTLLASRASLVASARSTIRQPAKPGAALAVRVEELLGALNSGTRLEGLDGIAVEPTTSAGPAPSTGQATSMQVTSIEQQIAAGHLRYIRGNRLASGDVSEGDTDAAGIRIIGPAEVFGELSLGQRRIDRLRFAGQYPAGRVTEPGDVVFCTSPRPAAIVDTEGTSVVAFPARILRIDPSDPNGLLSEVLVADIAAVPVTSKQWKSWPLRQSDHRQRGALADAIASIRLQQEQARARLAQLDELSSLLIAGVTAGSMTLTTTSDLPAPPEGTN